MIDRRRAFFVTLPIWVIVALMLSRLVWLIFGGRN
jgi:hypothetical protein